MKTVFRGSELPHLWAHGRIDQGRAGNESVNGCVYYSYQTAIGERQGGYYLISSDSHSASTARHIAEIRRAIPGGMPIFQIPSRSGASKLSDIHPSVTGKKVRAYALEQAAKCALKANKARLHKESLLESSLHWIKKAKQAEEVFHLEPAQLNLEVSKIHSQLEAERKENVKRKAEHREREARQAEIDTVKWESDLSAWMRGEAVSYPHAIGGGERLRLLGDIIETSKGVPLPVEAVKIAYKFALRHRENGWHRNGETFKVADWQLDNISENGVIAGCHRFSWNEIERFASLMEWNKTEPVA